MSFLYIPFPYLRVLSKNLFLRFCFGFTWLDCKGAFSENTKLTNKVQLSSIIQLYFSVCIIILWFSKEIKFKRSFSTKKKKKSNLKDIYIYIAMCLKIIQMLLVHIFNKDNKGLRFCQFINNLPSFFLLKTF